MNRKTNMSGTVTGLFFTALLVAFPGLAEYMINEPISALAEDRKPIPIPEEPTEMTYKSLRGVIYCEVWLFKGTPETGIAGVY